MLKIAGFENAKIVKKNISFKGVLAIK